MTEGLATFIERHVQAQLYDLSFAGVEAFSGNLSYYKET